MTAATYQEQSKKEFSKKKKKFTLTMLQTTTNRTRNLITARHMTDLPSKLLITLSLTDMALSMFVKNWEGLGTISR
jgi:hypothetical protein